jgi:hypothetical protein
MLEDKQSRHSLLLTALQVGGVLHAMPPSVLAALFEHSQMLMAAGRVLEYQRGCEGAASDRDAAAQGVALWLAWSGCGMCTAQGWHVPQRDACTVHLQLAMLLVCDQLGALTRLPITFTQSRQPPQPLSVSLLPTLPQWTRCNPRLLSVPLKQLVPWQQLGQVTQLLRLSPCMRFSSGGLPSAFLPYLKQWLLRQLASGACKQRLSAGSVTAAGSALRHPCAVSMAKRPSPGD